MVQQKDLRTDRIDGIDHKVIFRLVQYRLRPFIAQKFIHDGLDRPITFHRYPRSAQWLLALRERINRELCR